MFGIRKLTEEVKEVERDERSDSAKLDHILANQKLILAILRRGARIKVTLGKPIPQ